MRVVRVIVLAVLCLPGFVCAAPLRVVLDENYPPFVHRNPDGSLEGYTIDLWRLWERKTGRKAELVAVNWAQAQPMLEAGRADVIVDNTQRWSGDHCSVDPDLVPGILFSTVPLPTTSTSAPDGGGWNGTNASLGSGVRASSSGSVHQRVSIGSGQPPSGPGHVLPGCRPERSPAATAGPAARG